MNRMTTGVKWLLIINSVLFVVYFLSARTALGEIFLLLSLVPRSVLSSFAIWQLFTYMFLHSPLGFGHILMNMLALWMFGTPLESVWGTRRFLQFYFFCGVGAGICVVLLNLFFGSLDTRTIGASGAIYGTLMAFGILFPKVTTYFFGLFPIEARWMVVIIGAIVFLSSLSDSGGSVSHFAHLGGMLFGYIWLRFNLGHKVKSRTDWRGELQQRYKDWKLRRAKKKFQVYLKRHGSSTQDRRGGPGDWIQ
ncbi:MAG: rhomboid family intramembrane serine protease [Paludibaculum sp.]